MSMQRDAFLQGYMDKVGRFDAEPAVAPVREASAAPVTEAVVEPVAPMQPSPYAVSFLNAANTARRQVRGNYTMQNLAALQNPGVSYSKPPVQFDSKNGAPLDPRLKNVSNRMLPGVSQTNRDMAIRRGAVAGEPSNLGSSNYRKYHTPAEVASNNAYSDTLRDKETSAMLKYMNEPSVSRPSHALMKNYHRDLALLDPRLISHALKHDSEGR